MVELSEQISRHSSYTMRITHPGCGSQMYPAKGGAKMIVLYGIAALLTVGVIAMLFLFVNGAANDPVTNGRL